jgi:hypothetical protein
VPRGSGAEFDASSNEPEALWCGRDISRLSLCSRKHLTACPREALEAERSARASEFGVGSCLALNSATSRPWREYTSNYNCEIKDGVLRDQGWVRARSKSSSSAERRMTGRRSLPCASTPSPPDRSRSSTTSRARAFPLPAPTVALRRPPWQSRRTLMDAKPARFPGGVCVLDGDADFRAAFAQFLRSTWSRVDEFETRGEALR